MTTLAWDGRTLAADKRTCSNGIARTCTKLWQLGDYVYAGTGPFDEVLLVRKWLELGAPSERPPHFDEGGIRGMVLHIPTGKLSVVEGKATVMWEVEEPFHAEGSGREFALSALAFGKNAREAIAFAGQFDLATGNGIDAFDLPASPP
jgi:hypothetical protein